MNQNWYKYIGRLDDTLVHVLGEKTNPGTFSVSLLVTSSSLINLNLRTVPIELCIRGNSPYVTEGIEDEWSFALA